MQAQPHDCETLRDEDRTPAVAGRNPMIFWIILLVLSSLVISDVGDLIAAFSWIGSIALVGGVFFLSRRNQFIRKSSDLVEKGQSLESYQSTPSRLGN